MAGQIERQALKRAALLALEESRAALGGEVLRVRVEWSPRELVRQSVERHKVAIAVGALIAGLAAARFFTLPRPERSWRSAIRGRLAALAATTLWTAFQDPITDFAKSRLAAYFDKFHPDSDPQKPNE